MSRHAAPRRRARPQRRWFGSGRTRALLTLGVVLLLGAVGTSAYWTDTATLDAGTIASGTMDLQLQTTPSGIGAVGAGTGHTETSIAITGLTPGESHTFPVTLRNVGDADFLVTGTVQQGATPAWTYVNTPIRVEFFLGGIGAEDTTYPITEACAAPAATAGPTATVGAAGSTALTSLRINKGANQPLCLRVFMVAGAANENQGRTGSLRFDFTATQVIP